MYHGCELYRMVVAEGQYDFVVRTYLLHLVGCTILADKPHTMHDWCKASWFVLWFGPLRRLDIEFDNIISLPWRWLCSWYKAGGREYLPDLVSIRLYLIHFGFNLICILFGLIRFDVICSCLLQFSHVSSLIKFDMLDLI